VKSERYNVKGTVTTRTPYDMMLPNLSRLTFHLSRTEDGLFDHPAGCVGAIWNDSLTPNTKLLHEFANNLLVNNLEGGWVGTVAGGRPLRQDPGRVYRKWLPAPMKNNMGIESMRFTRDAINADRPH